MNRNEHAESSSSRRGEKPCQPEQNKRPALLKRLFGRRNPRKHPPVATREQQARCPSRSDQEMLLV